MAELTNPLTTDGTYTVDLGPEGRYALVVNVVSGTIGTSLKAQWAFDEGAMDIPGASFTADGAVEFVAAGCRTLNIVLAGASSLVAHVHVSRISG